MGKHRYPATHCEKGHKFTPENTYVYPSGKRACRICKRAYSVQWRKRHPSYHQEWRRVHSRYHQEWRRVHPHYDRERALRDYGLDLSDYETLLSAQGGCCAICRSEPEQRALCVDHDHKTEKVRGLLCDPCNRALGGFRDDHQIVQRAADYLAPTKKH